MTTGKRIVWARRDVPQDAHLYRSLSPEPPEPNAFGSVRIQRGIMRAVGVEKRFWQSVREPGGCRTVANGMEELGYAACEASFEAKSGDEGCSGIGRRRPVSITSGHIRSDQRADGGYVNDEQHHAGARNYFRRRGNIRRQLGDLLCFRQGKHRSARVRHTACQRRRLRRL
jgi:hypothetical protein